MFHIQTTACGLPLLKQELSWTWRCMPITPVLRRLRWEGPVSHCCTNASLVGEHREMDAAAAAVGEHGEMDAAAAVGEHREMDAAAQLPSFFFV